MAELASWNDTATRQAIEEYVASAPAADRVAVFDNDGTLWCEKPMPIQLDFILRRWGAMAEDDASLRERQPFKAAHARDFGWLARAITKHYDGDDSDVKLLMARRRRGVRRHERRRRTPTRRARSSPTPSTRR